MCGPRSQLILPTIIPVPHVVSHEVLPTNRDKQSGKLNKMRLPTLAGTAPGYRLEWKIHDAVVTLYRIRIRGAASMMPAQQKKGTKGVWALWT